MSTPTAPPDVEMLTVDSPVLGPLTLDATDLYTFRNGLIGLEDYRRFALVESGRPGFWWLQSADEPALVFLVADPFLHVAGYDADVPDVQLAPLGPARADELLVLAVVTLPGGGGEATVNVRAPLVLHTGTRLGQQVVLTSDRWSVAEPIRIAARSA